MHRPSHLIPQHRRYRVWESPFMRLLAVIMVIVAVAGWLIITHIGKQNATAAAVAAAWQELETRQVVLTLAGTDEESKPEASPGSAERSESGADARKPGKSRATEIRATPGQLRSWAQVSPAPGAGKPRVTVQFQESKVARWVTQVASQLEHSPENGQRQIDAEGRLVRLLKDPVNGVKVNNTKESTQHLMQALRQGERQIKIKMTTDSSPGGFDDSVVPAPPLAYQAPPSQRWVDVNLSNHTTAVYQGNQVIFGPVATIDGHPQGPTPEGVFKVYYKLNQQVMRGTGWDGPYEEAAPWIAYFNGDYALHGAPWRHTFVWNPEKGSHGCINMSVNDAKQVFDLVSNGTPVVVHK